VFEGSGDFSDISGDFGGIIWTFEMNPFSSSLHLFLFSLFFLSVLSL
jgi:hypothetical protein